MTEPTSGTSSTARLPPEPVVRFRELPTRSGHRFGVATLNAPSALNALSSDMVRLLDPQLRAWRDDPQIAGVLLDAAGDKAFCAGGDLRRLYAAIRAAGPARNAEAEAFFSEEYALDHLIHRFPKPVLAWAHGIVMGGGVGLMAGASHRVVTESTRLAMPEIGIGLFPDVGGSWFLRRMPGRVGLFLALTAAPLNAADALHVGIADAFVPHARKAAVLEALAAAEWAGDEAADRARLTDLLRTAGEGAALPDAMVPRHRAAIDALMADEVLADIASRLGSMQGQDAWLQAAGETFTRGSPTSAALAFALWQRAEGRSLGELLRLEYHAALGCCAHADFPEGIRALLIDKDRRPRWQPARLADVTEALVEDHLQPRGELPARLAHLD
ncbi:enoyl-CoA hydratase/isomerase family protein [Rhizobacter sp. LjRoot28]|uniref:enoyl-CoA hydratase/isomerase family protein n=1 Tax=Rhizobacter sp. LjRoot28 TaxID=3342309 RepID=UPI003ED11B51